MAKANNIKPVVKAVESDEKQKAWRKSVNER